MTLLKRKTPRVTKSINGKEFFAKDFAYVEDETDPTTWKYRLTDRPNGKPTPARVNAAIKQFTAQRYAIPSDALDSILDKLREAWMKAFPNKDPASEMPGPLAEEGSEGDLSTGKPPVDEQVAKPEDEGEDEVEVDEEGNPIEGGAKEGKPENKPPFAGEGEGDPEDDEDEDEDEDDLVGKILKGYYDASEGSKTFAEVLDLYRQQDEHHEMVSEAWPVISALDNSIRSIVGDPDIDSAAKHTMLRSSVEGFLAAIREVMPEVEEVLEKALSSVTTTTKGDSNMRGKVTGAAGGDDLQKQLDELKKNFEASEKAREEAVAKAERLEAIAALSAEEKEFFDKAKDKDEFLKMSKADRAKAIKKARTEDETIELDGQTFSKSNTDPAVWAFIKGQVARTEALEKKLNEEREARENVELAKRVKEEFSHLPGTDEEKLELVKSLNALPEAARKTMETVLKAASATASLAFQRLGSRGGREQSVEKSEAGLHPFEKAVGEIRVRDNCTHSEAMRKARQEHPEAFADYNGTAH